MLDSTVAPLVGTFHCYSENAFSHGIANGVFGVRRKLQRLNVRIAVSEAAAWTGQRFYGGRYRIIPNGVDLPAAIRAKAPADGRPLRLAFVGQAVERKGLPVLLRAFEALREHIPVELVIVGAGEEDVAPLLLDPTGVRVLGKVSDERKHAALESADLLVAPSLGGESFGMVLTESFAAGTPVVASDIAGYRDVVHDGEDGVLVPRGDPTALAETLRDLALDPARRARMAGKAAVSADRYAWPTVAAEVLRAYEDAVAMPAPATSRERTRVFLGSMPADGQPLVRPQRLPSLEPKPPEARSPARVFARRAVIAIAAVGGAALSWLALQRIGLDQIGQSLVAATPWWVVVALGLMCLSMAVRGVAWHAILRAALPQSPLRPVDALQGTFIGVLMSATLPARLGEPSRALIVARRTGRPRENLPTVVGTIVSQTLLNVARARAARRRDVLDRVAVQRAPPRRWSSSPRAARDPRGGAGHPDPAAQGRDPAIAPRAGVGPQGARRRRPGAPGLGCSATRASEPPRPCCSSPHGRCSGCPATRCSPRWASTTSPAWAPPRPCSSRST